MGDSRPGGIAMEAVIIGFPCQQNTLYRELLIDQSHYWRFVLRVADRFHDVDTVKLARQQLSILNDLFEQAIAALQYELWSI